MKFTLKHREVYIPKIKENRKNIRLENCILYFNDYYFGADVSISRLRRTYGPMGAVLPSM